MTDFNDTPNQENNDTRNTENQNTGFPPQDTSTNNGWTGYSSQQPGYTPPTSGSNDYSQWNTGSAQSWQNPSPNTNPSEEYSWKFEDYDQGNAKAPKGKKPKKNKGFKVFAGLLCGVLAVGVLTFSGYGVYSMFFSSSNLLPNTSNSQSGGNNGNSPSLDIKDTPKTEETNNTEGPLNATQIAAKVKPSVVGVVQYQYSSSSIEASGEGSGVIMSADGYILTNAHVIAGASGIKVVLNDGQEYEARVIGTDTQTDLAVIKIEATNLTPAEFGDSSKVQEGDTVMAIGNPGGLTFAGSITQGIISGTNRQVSSESADMTYLQTDAAINPGNSGGALVNVYGQVIGINSAKISATEYEGIGFAIPMNQAKPIVDDLVANGRVTGRVMLGVVNPVAVDEIAARVYGVPVGVQITSTDPNSDLANKGVAPGDIITKINGADVTSVTDIRKIIGEFKVGDTVKLTVFRRTTGQSDKTFEVSVTLMEDTGTSSNNSSGNNGSNGSNGQFGRQQGQSYN